MTGDQQRPPMVGGNGRSPMTSPEGLDLVEEEEQITHEIQLEKDLKVDGGLCTYSIYYTLAPFKRFDDDKRQTSMTNNDTRATRPRSRRASYDPN